MADCSKTEVFLKEWKRMCDSVGCTCLQCCLYEMVDAGSSCRTAMRKMPKQVIMEVQKWSDEHSIKTRQVLFLKLFPNARMRHCDNDYLVLDVCPAALDNRFSCEDDISCADCQKDYWLQEVD